MDHETQHDGESDPHDVAGDTLGQPAADDVAARDEARQPTYTNEGGPDESEEVKGVTIPADELVGEQADVDADMQDAKPDGEPRQPPQPLAPEMTKQPPVNPAHSNEPGAPAGGNAPTPDTPRPEDRT